MKLFPTKFVLIFACVCAWFFILARPTLATLNSPDARTIKLAKFFHNYNSPLEPYAQDFIDQADKNSLDYRLLPAISGVESTFGRNYNSGSFNVYGWGGGNVYFSSWEDGIASVSKGIKENYVDKGAKDINAISWIYCPPGNLNWAVKVKNFMTLIDNTDTSITPDSPLKTLDLTI